MRSRRLWRYATDRDYQLFDTASHREAICSAPIVGPIRAKDGTLRTFDLAEEHARISQELEQEFVATASDLHDIVMNLLALLHPEWAQRFSLK